MREFCLKDMAIVYNLLQSQILEALGATVERVRPVSITHKDHYVNVARRRAQEANELAGIKQYNQVNGKHLELVNGCELDLQKQSPGFLHKNCRGGFFADQFENLANFRAHYEGTGPEIWEQTGGTLDAFVAAAGTGGTVAGVSRFIQVKIHLKKNKTSSTNAACSFFCSHINTSCYCMLYRRRIQISSVF